MSANFFVFIILSGQSIYRGFMKLSMARTTMTTLFLTFGCSLTVCWMTA